MAGAHAHQLRSVRFRSVIAFAVLVVSIGGCTGDPTTSDEYVSLNGDLLSTQLELARVESALIEVSAERDELEQASESSAARVAELVALDVIEAAVNAYNVGDGEAWALARVPRSYFASQDEYDAELHEVAEWAEMMHAVGGHMEIRECAYAGFDTWTTVQDPGVDPPVGHLFLCEVASTDVFVDAAHIEWVEEFKWVVDDGEVVAVTADSSANEEVKNHQYFEAFARWIEQTRPELVEGLGFRWHWELPSGLPEIARLSYEFVAESPEWPRPEDLPLPDPVLTSSVGGIDIYNADARQESLVRWALGQFAAAGLSEPDLISVTFPPTQACREGKQGIARFSAASAAIEVCATSDSVSESEPELSATRSILHELAHVWTHQHLEDTSRMAFLEQRELTDWNAPTWQDSGSEQAAEILAWGLTPRWTIPRVPKAKCSELLPAFDTLTQSAPTPRTTDCSTGTVDYNG